MVYAVIARKMGAWAYKAGVGVALVSGLALGWSTMVQTADSGHPERLWYLSVLVVGIIGAGLTRLKAPGLAVTLFAMAAVLALMSAVLPSGAPSDMALRMAIGHGVFVSLFTASGLLLRHASLAGWGKTQADYKSAAGTHSFGFTSFISWTLSVHAGTCHDLCMTMIRSDVKHDQVIMTASDDCLLESEVRKANWLRSRDLGLSLREFWDDFEGKNAVLSRLKLVFGESRPGKVPKKAAKRFVAGKTDKREIERQDSALRRSEQLFWDWKVGR
jgi:hypothetical protein